MHQKIESTDISVTKRDNEKTERVIYLDILRIAATFAVIMIHVTGLHWMSLDLYSSDWDIYNLFRGLSRWAVPIFVMISGSVFLCEKRTTKYETILKKNLIRIFTAFLFWSVVYALYNYNGSISQLIHDIIRGSGHMWFLYLIAVLYLLTPLLRWIYSSCGGGVFDNIYCVWIYHSCLSRDNTFFAFSSNLGRKTSYINENCSEGIWLDRILYLRCVFAQA